MIKSPEIAYLEKFTAMISSLDFAMPNEEFFICHYTSASALESIFKKTYFRFTRWDFLNDESEFVHIHEIVKSCLKEKMYSKKFKEQILSINDIIEKLMGDETYPSKENYYILSFSANPDSLPMWSYYTKNKQSDGYNIEFDANVLMPFLKGNTNVETKLIKLIYKTSEKKRIVSDLLDNLHEMYVKLGDVPNRNDIVLLSFEVSIKMISKYFKHDAFEYEDEYRIIVEAPAEYEKVIEKDDVFVPYIELDFPKESVKCINISPTLSKRNPQIGLRTLLKNNGYDCNIIHSTIPFRNI